MLFIVQFEDVYVERPERLPERATLMLDHLRFLAEQGDRVVAAGAPRASVDDIPAGGVWMLNVESKSAAETCYQEDPLRKAGLRKSVRVSHWARAYWSQRTYALNFKALAPIPQFPRTPETGKRGRVPPEAIRRQW